MWIDVGSLIRQHIPDKDGNVLPENLSMGTYEIRQPGELGVGSLFEGKVVYDKMYGHVTYGCATCCGLKEYQFDFDPLGIPLNGTAQQSVEGVNNCQGTWTDITGYFNGGSWATANHAIATVNTNGLHSGASEGSTTTSACSKNDMTVWENFDHCPLLPVCPDGATDQVNAVPVNFHQTATQDIGGGDLHFWYAWESSTGNLSDLSSCTVGEIVTYQGPNPFQPPSPPFPTGTFQNPTVNDGAATAGTGEDDNKLPSTTFVKPYSDNSFTAVQYFRYRCSNVNNGNYVNLIGPLSIVRSVSQNPDGSWKFTVTKPTNGVATINPLP